MRIFSRVSDLTTATGEHLGLSDWVTVDQGMVEAFAETTGDRQWIHVDPRRAASGPYGRPVAHGYLLLSLLPMLAAQVYEVRGVAAAVNYGLDRVRFPAPVPVGSRIRAGVELVSTEPGSGGATHAVVRLTVWVDGGTRPACVAETVRRFLPGGGDHV
jgi:acyl dehydratase